MQYQLLISADSAEELAAIVAKLEGTSDEKPKRGKTVVADEEVESEDEKPKRGKKEEDSSDDSDVDAKRENIRKHLRKLAELTDRKTAQKVLSKFASCCDEIEEDELDNAMTAVKKAIAAAE